MTNNAKGTFSRCVHISIRSKGYMSNTRVNAIVYYTSTSV